MVKTHSDLSLTAEMIVKAHRSPLGEFRGFIVEGRPREGKTVYGIKVLRDVMMALHPEMTEEQAYAEALKHIFFEVEPFMDSIEAKQREIREALPKIDWCTRIPAVVLDDASLYAGADLYFRDQSMYSRFQNTMTTIGSAVSGIIITTPHHLALTKCIREYYSYYVVKITKYDEYRREAKVQEWYEDSRHRLKLREYGTDEYTARVPNDIYAEYLAPRLEKGEQAAKEAKARAIARAEEIRKVAEEVTIPPQPKPKWELNKYGWKKRIRRPVVEEIAQRAGMNREEYIRMLAKRRAEIAT